MTAMPVIKRAKTAFTAGELAPELLGRSDVPAWANGAMRLRNVIIQLSTAEKNQASAAE